MISFSSGQMSAFTRYNVWLLLIFMIGGGAAIFAFNHEMKKEALKDAESTARVLLDHNLAIHAYFNDSLKPHVFAVTEGVKGHEYFDPTWMSSTFAVREMDKIFKAHSPGNYYYKEAAINARSPANEADAWERDFIRRLNVDPALVVNSDIRDIDGKPYFVVLRRGEAMGKDCLRCHDTPDLAPAGLVEYYGPDRSFGRKLGEVVSAISIRVPLEEAYAKTDTLTLWLSGILAGVLLAVFFLQSVLSRRIFVEPILSLENQARALAAAPERLGEELPTPEGRELRALTEAFNIMSRRLAEDAKSKDALLENIMAAKAELEQFNYVASHDLREPLRMVVSYIQLLEKHLGDGLDKDSQEYMAFAVEGALRIRQLLSDLLLFSKLDTESRSPVAIDCAEAVVEAKKNLERALEAKKGFIHYSALPKVMADPPQLARLFNNLLDNAVKYSRPDVPPKINVSAERDKDGFWKITVEDNGEGIDVVHRDRIFDIFQRLHGRTENSGTGIGLSVCKKIVERHGGRIWVSSTPGIGSAFHFTLPGVDAHGSA